MIYYCDYRAKFVRAYASLAAALDSLKVVLLAATYTVRKWRPVKWRNLLPRIPSYQPYHAQVAQSINFFVIRTLSTKSSYKHKPNPTVHTIKQDLPEVWKFNAVFFYLNSRF